MNEEFKKYKDNFMKNNFYKWEEISKEEYQLVPDTEKENYYVESFDIKNDITNITEIDYKYYKKVPEQLNDEELNLYLQMEILESNKQMKETQSTMKSIMVFWMILTILSLVGSFYIVSKIGSIFN